MLVRARNHTDATILQAAADGDLEFLKQQALSDAQLVNSSTCSSGCTALHWAAGMNQVHIIRYLLDLSRSNNPIISTNSFDTAPSTIASKLAFHVNQPIAKKYKAAGRTPLHYAARNGCLEAAKCLIEQFYATPDATAKHGVTPLHLACFQNQKNVAEYLLQLNSGIDLFQTNNYGCNVLHWLAICPVARAGPDGGSHLVQTAQWLFEMQQQKLHPLQNSNAARVPKSDVIDLFHAKQTQGHTALHKAAWLGHYALIRYLHECHNLWDDAPDHSGNYAVTLAEMARHDDNDATVNYLRMFCSRSAAHSCSILSLSIQDINNPARIRRAYLDKALEYHPDRHVKRNQGFSKRQIANEIKEDSYAGQSDCINISFDDVQKAYNHLLYEKGRGLECNNAHKLRILLPSSEEASLEIDDDCFKTRLVVVLREYGSKGLDISNLKKKWKQVWHTNFPTSADNVPLTRWLQEFAADVVEIRSVDQCHRAYVKIQQ
jgi:Ankyrin repeats (3 copies)/Ankyrin repeat